MLRLAMVAFRRSPRGHDWSVVGQAEKVLLWAFYSTDQAKRQEIDLNHILVMIPSNQISTNIKKFTWIEWIFCLSAGIIWGWKNKRQKRLANRLFGLFESTKKAKKCEFQNIKHGLWHVKDVCQTLTSNNYKLHLYEMYVLLKIPFHRNAEEDILIWQH